MQDAGDTSTTVELVLGDGTEVIVARLDSRRPDLELIDVLARFGLSARRRGGSIRLRDASDQLIGLIALLGLVEVLPLEDPRKTEGAEQLGVEEVVQSDDTLA